MKAPTKQSAMMEALEYLNKKSEREAKLAKEKADSEAHLRQQEIDLQRQKLELEKERLAMEKEERKLMWQQLMSGKPNNAP